MNTKHNFILTAGSFGNIEETVMTMSVDYDCYKVHVALLFIYLCLAGHGVRVVYSVDLRTTISLTANSQADLE